MASHRSIALAVACYAMGVGSIMMLGASSCLSAIAADLGMATELVKGLFLSSSTWSSMVVSLVSGWLVDRLGYRLQLLISSLMQAAGLAVIALSMDQWQALAGGVITGLGRGMMSAPMTALVCNLYPENRTRMAGVHHSSWYIGTVLILVLVLVAFEVGIGWRTLFAVFAVMVLLYSPAAMLRSLPGPTPARAAGTGARLPIWKIARDRTFWLIAVGLFFTAITEVTAGSWLPYYMEVGIGSSRSQGAIGLMVFAAVMAVGRLSMPWAIRRVGLRTVFIVAGLACTISSPLAAWHDHPFFVVMWLCVLGFAVSGLFPSVNAHAGDRFPTAGSTMFAVLNSIALVGALTGPVVFGFAADFTGLRWAMAMMAIAPLLWMVGLVRAVEKRNGGHIRDGNR